MADVVASEVTEVSCIPMGKLGYDLVLKEFFIDHSFVTNDEISAEVLGLAALVGIIGASRSTTGTLAAVGVQDANALSLKAGTRANIAADVAGFSLSGTDDVIVVGSSLNSDDGLWLTVLGRAH